MMEVSIKDFLNWYRKGSYDINDPVVSHWMKDIYELMGKLTNQFLFDNFYIRTNCNERYLNKSGQYRILLLPYDKRLEMRYGMEIRIDDRGERKYLVINDNVAEFGTEAGLLKALNDIHPESDAVTYHIELTFLWDDGDDTKDAMITVPGSVPVGRINFILQKKHEELDASDLYGKAGRNPETLLNEVCRENGWTWEEPEFDLVAEFN